MDERQLDNEQPCAAEANAAKYLAGEAGFRACENAVMTHGGMGYANQDRWGGPNLSPTRSKERPWVFDALLQGACPQPCHRDRNLGLAFADAISQGHIALDAVRSVGESRASDRHAGSGGHFSAAGARCHRCRSAQARADLAHLLGKRRHRVSDQRQLGASGRMVCRPHQLAHAYDYYRR